MNINNNKKLIFIVSLVAVAIVIATSIILIRSNSPERKIREQLAIGNKYLSELNYEQAIASFEAVLEINPKIVDAYLGLADSYIGMGDEIKAIELLKTGYENTIDAKIKERLFYLEQKNEEDKRSMNLGQSDADTATDTAFTKEQIITIYNAASEIWDYEIMGRRFREWDTDSLISYLDQNFEAINRRDDDVSYVIVNGISSAYVFYDRPTIDIFGMTENGYIHFEKILNGTTSGSINGSAPQYPLIGMDINIFFSEYGVTIDDLLSGSVLVNDSEDNREYSYQIDDRRRFNITVRDEIKGDYCFMIIDYNDEIQAYISVKDFIVDGVGVVRNYF